jgi:hypothetical protein
MPRAFMNRHLKRICVTVRRLAHTVPLPPRWWCLSAGTYGDFAAALARPRVVTCVTTSTTTTRALGPARYQASSIRVLTRNCGWISWRLRVHGQRNLRRKFSIEVQIRLRPDGGRPAGPGYDILVPRVTTAWAIPFSRSWRGDRDPTTASFAHRRASWGTHDNDTFSTGVTIGRSTRRLPAPI